VTPCRDAGADVAIDTFRGADANGELESGGVA